MKFKSRKPLKKEAKRNGRNSWPTTYRWTAMGTIVACSAVGSKTLNVAQAQTVPQPGGGVSQTQAQRFDIPSGPLSEVLPQFARVAGVTFTLSADSIGTLTSPGVSGIFTVQQALQHLVDGTSVTFRFTAPTVVAFQLRGRTESVEVTGRIPGADPYADPEAPYKAELSSKKFAESALNTARTETILTQEALEDKNATTLREVLRSTAGVTLGSGEGGNAFGDRFFVRGFDARNDVFSTAFAIPVSASAKISTGTGRDPARTGLLIRRPGHDRRRAEYRYQRSSGQQLLSFRRGGRHRRQ